MNANEIRDLRNEKGWTLQALADALCVDLSSALRWERGASSPSHLAAEKLERLRSRSIPPSVALQPTLQQAGGAARLDADAIKKLRKDTGWSQKDLAERIGVSRVTLERWECGRTRPAPLALEQLEHLLAAVAGNRAGPKAQSPEDAAECSSPARWDPAAIRRLREERGWSQHVL